MSSAKSAAMSTQKTMDLAGAAQIALEHAKHLGMDQCEVALHNGTGVSVSVRQQELETVEKHNDAELIISVYQNHKTGSASTADMSEKSIRDTVQAAASIASFTGADEAFGLADKQLMAAHAEDLQLYHPWLSDIDSFTAIALQCEEAALQYDQRITNSEGAAVNTYNGTAVYANSYGFYSEHQASQHSVSCSVIGSSDNGMQRDYWYDSQRDASKLQDASEIGRQAAERTVQRLGARKISSTHCPVLFDATIASSLIGHLIGALKGGAIYKKASFLLDKLDQAILPDHVSITEYPHLLGASRSAWHDSEGVATPQQSHIVLEGHLQRYVLGSYTARKLGLQTTANAGGVRNLKVSDSGKNRAELISDMHNGLLVTELIGSGINPVTGDYSRGAAGFWVENGEIQYPVEEITIAGNLLDMYRTIAAIGNDRDLRGNTHCGSILLDEMTLAGE